MSGAHEADPHDRGRQQARADDQVAWVVAYQRQVADLIETSDQDTDEGELERRRLRAMAPHQDDSDTSL